MSLVQSDEPQVHLTLVTQVFYPDQQATSQLLSGLASSLADRQRARSPIRAQALCGYPSRARGGSSEVSSREVYQGVEIRRGGLKIDAKRSLAHRALAYSSFLLWLSFYLIFKTPSHHRVLVVTNPPFAPLIVWICARLRSLWGTSYRYVALLHDLYPDGLVALDKARSDGWWVRVWMRLNRAALGRADRVITLGRDMSRHCHDVYQVPQERLTCITNWSPVEWREEQRCSPEETQLFKSLPEHARRSGVLLVQYSGNMGLWHNIDELVRAADLLRDEPIHFVMIGEGRRKAAALELSKSLDLKNMTWLPFQPLESLTDSLQCAHLSLVSQRPEVLGIMVPSKLYGVLASGRGVLAQAPSESEVAYTLTERACGVVLNTPDASSLAAQLRNLARQPNEVTQMGINARVAYQQHHSYSRAVEMFDQLLRAL